MVTNPNPSQLVWLPVAALVAWRMYSRMRRLVGRQTFSRKRALATVILFPLVLLLMTVSAPPQGAGVAALVAGLALGAALGILGFRLTAFEETPSGLAYTPSAHIGVAMSLLLVGRIVYRMVQVSLHGAEGASQAGFVTSPVTMGIFACLAGYYVSYAVGLLRRAGRVGGVAAPGR